MRHDHREGCQLDGIIRLIQHPNSAKNDQMQASSAVSPHSSLMVQARGVQVPRSSVSNALLTCRIA